MLQEACLNCCGWQNASSTSSGLGRGEVLSPFHLMGATGYVELGDSQDSNPLFRPGSHQARDSEEQVWPKRGACQPVASTQRTSPNGFAQVFFGGPPSLARSWFFQPSAARLEELAAQQTAVVEDLAGKMDQEAALKCNKETLEHPAQPSGHPIYGAQGVVYTFFKPLEFTFSTLA